MDKLKDILMAIGCFLLSIICLILFIYGSNSDNIKHTFKAFIGFIISFGLGATFVFLELSDFIIEKKRNKEIENIINKTNKTSYDNLKIDVVNGSADKLIIQYLTENNKKPYDLYFEYKRNKVYLYYCYQGFYVDIEIDEKSISLNIDSPNKYDYVDGNKELEKEKVIDCNLNEMMIEDIYVFISNIIKEYNYLIVDFKKTNIPNEQINGKKLAKIEKYTRENKVLGIVLSLFGIELSLLGGMFIYKCIINDKNFIADNLILAWIFSIVMFGLGVISLIYSIKILYKLCLFKKDKKLLQVSNVNGNCVKVKFYVDGAHRSNDINLKTISLYLKNNNKIEKAIIIVEKRFKVSSFKPMKLKKIILDNTYNLQCLTYSRYVLSGASKILHLINN